MLDLTRCLFVTYTIKRCNPYNLIKIILGKLANIWTTQSTNLRQKCTFSLVVKLLFVAAIDQA